MARASSGAEDFGLGDANQVGAVDDVVLAARPARAGRRRFPAWPATKAASSATTARAAFASSRAMASSALARSFSTEASRESASISRARITMSASGGHAPPAPPASQPSHSARAKSVADQAGRPTARPPATTSAPKAADEEPRQAIERRLRRGRRRRDCESPGPLRRRRRSRSGTTTAGIERARLARRFGLAPPADAAALSVSSRKAAGLRGALMRDGLRSGTAARGRA